MKKWGWMMALFSTVFLAAGLKSEINNKVGDVHVQVDGIVSPKGVLRVSLFNSKQGFPSQKKQAYRRHVVEQPNMTVEVVFIDIPYGTYAVSALHDCNNNGQLDKNFFGIPKEPIAVSKNPKIRYGPPKFKEAQFVLDSIEKSISIHLPTKR